MRLLNLLQLGLYFESACRAIQLTFYTSPLIHEGGCNHCKPMNVLLVIS